MRRDDRGAALVVGSRVGARDDMQVGILVRARKPADPRESPTANDDRPSTVCSSESLVSAWSPVLIHIPRRNHLSDTVGTDPDLPLQIRRPPSIGFEKVVMVFAHQTQVRQRGGATSLPRDDVMSVTVSGRPITPCEDTALVAGMQGLPDGWGDEAVFLPDVEYPGRSAQHDRQNVGVTGVLAEFGRGQRVTVRQACVPAVLE